MFRDGFFHADLHPGNMFVDAKGALAVVDFGIMGRLDRATRYYLADMLIGFLTGDYRRVAEVHFEAGYVPRRRSIDAFTQACRSIGEPILDLPLHEISIAKLLAQLFQVTEQFEMETQPQLLLLQKTMVLVEGIGRRLDPSVNIWTLARPIVEQWMRENRGPEAQLRQQHRHADRQRCRKCRGCCAVSTGSSPTGRARASGCTPRASPRRRRTGRACCRCW